MDKKRLKRDTIRLYIQVIFAVISNGWLKGFYTKKIYTGSGKYLCTPGMNCYSCPGALASCPIGSLQAVLNDRQYKISLYVLGLLFVFGSIFGRLICGFLCPFGLIQDLLYKIPFIKKIRKLPAEKALRGLRFVILIVFVILLPMFVTDVTGLGKPWFCKYICPVGTLEGGIVLVLLQEGMRSSIGFLFKWKMLILIFTVLMSIIIYRFFCRYICPLGAVYGLFNKAALYRYTVDLNECSGCGACKNACRLDISVWENPNSTDCIRCGACMDACPEKCIRTIISSKIIKIGNKH